jgi:hypothetical protein
MLWMGTVMTKVFRNVVDGNSHDQILRNVVDGNSNDQSKVLFRYLQRMAEENHQKR